MWTPCLYRKELILPTRRRFFYLRRCLLAVLFGIYLLIVLLIGLFSPTSAAGMGVFHTMSYGLLLLAMVAAPVAGGQSIFVERQGHMLGLLELAGISIRQLVFNKCLAVCTTSILLVFSLVPLFVLTVAMGGLLAVQVASGLLVLVGTIFLGSTAGMLAGCLANRESDLFKKLLLHGLLVFGLPALVIGWSSYSATGLPPWLPGLISGWFMMEQIILGTQLMLAPLHVLCCVLVGLVFLVLTVYLLPRREMNVESSWLVRWMEKTFPAKRPRPSSNPILWKDVHILYGSGVNPMLPCIALVVTGLVAAAGLSFTMPPLEAFGFCLGAVAAISLLAFISLCTVRAAHSFETEKQTGALHLLLTSGYNSNAIVYGKYFATWISGLPWLITGAACGFVYLVIAEYLAWGTTPLVLTVPHLSGFVVYCAVALWISVGQRPAMTVLYSMAVMLGWAFVHIYAGVFIAGIEAFASEVPAWILIPFGFAGCLALDAIMAFMVLQLFASVFRLSIDRRMKF